MKYTSLFFFFFFSKYGGITFVDRKSTTIETFIATKDLIIVGANNCLSVSPNTTPKQGRPSVGIDMTSKIILIIATVGPSRYQRTRIGKHENDLISSQIHSENSAI